MSRILQCWRQLQRSLFPGLEAELGPQSPVHGRIMVVLDWLDLGRFVAAPCGRGRPPACRQALAAAFVAKAVLNAQSTRALIDRLQADRVLRRLCGFDATRRLPSEATFSNAFAEFSASDFPSRLHEALVKELYGDRLENKIVGHVSRDSTDIHVRAKVRRKRKKKTRRQKGPKGKKRRVHRQLSMSLEEMLGDLPIAVDCGTKRGHSWKGLKLHLDVADGDIPLSAIMTSASVHDSQVAIPLEEMTSRRVTSLYSLMDSAYDAKEIREYAARKAKVAIIEPLNWVGQTATLDPAERRRFGQRTSVERVFSQLKDGFGARHIRVRAPPKIWAHLMFAVLALTATQTVRVFG